MLIIVDKLLLSPNKSFIYLHFQPKTIVAISLYVAENRAEHEIILNLLWALYLYLWRLITAIMDNQLCSVNTVEQTNSQIQIVTFKWYWKFYAAQFKKYNNVFLIDVVIKMYYKHTLVYAWFELWLKKEVYRSARISIYLLLMLDK